MTTQQGKHNWPSQTHQDIDQKNHREVISRIDTSGTRTFGLWVGAISLCLLLAQVAAQTDDTKNSVAIRDDQLSSVTIDDEYAALDPPDPDTQIKTPEWAEGISRRSEVVGFLVRGRRMHERLMIEDLDTIVTGDDIRLLPVLRLLRTFSAEITEVDNIITATPEGLGQVIIDLDKKQIQIDGQTEPLWYLEGSSVITMKRDIYVRPEVISRILDMELVWDNAFYEYRVILERTLSIWKREPGRSLFSIRALYMPPDMPEAHPAAEKSDSVFQFMEFKWNPRYIWDTSAGQDGTSQRITFSSPSQTVWGNLYGGRYKLRLSEREGLWDNSKDGGLRWSRKNESFAKVNWLEWVHHTENMELAFGDSSFAVGELIFPISNMTGVRFNGLLGFTQQELENDRSKLGFRRYFSKPYIFEGSAPVGATVELLLNDRVLETQEIFPDSTTPPGTGTYRFEDVRLPGGILNEIVILITELNGIQTRVERTIFGSALLLPQGRSAYLGILGSKRDLRVDRDRMKDIEFGDIFGEIAGGRFLYGVNDRLTIGGMFGYQHDFFRNQSASLSDERQIFPQNSTHAGLLATWLPFERLMVSGDLAISKGNGTNKYDDTAFRIRGDYLPTENISLNFDFLNIGTDYFDGQTLELFDRRGLAVAGRWKFDKKWRLQGAAGTVRNNLDGQLSDTLKADYQNIKIRTTAIPNSTLIFGINRLDPSWENSSQTLGEIWMRTSPFRGLSIYGQLLRGNEIDLGKNHDFFSGLKLAGVPRFIGPRRSISVRKTLGGNSSISLIHAKSEFEETVSLYHDMTVHFAHPLRIHTELEKNLDPLTSDDKYELRNRIEYLLDDSGRNRIGLQVESKQREWEILVYLNVNDLFTQHKGRLKRTVNRRIRPDYGGIHGRVFLDYNANARLDPGEPGLENIGVNLGSLYAAVTDKNGYYLLPGFRDTKKVRVFLDIDTVPAMYSVTHGTQLAHVVEGSLTEVNLAVTPLISMSGVVNVQTAKGKIKALPGIRMILESTKGKFIADSITASDGSYYLGDLRPGKYRLKIDTDTVNKKYHIPEPKRKITIEVGKDFQMIEIAEFKLIEK